MISRLLISLSIVTIVDQVVATTTPSSAHNHSQCIQAKSESGNCSQTLSKWRFDRSSALCEAFVYGGCGATGNIFDTQSKCKQACLSPTTPISASNSPTTRTPGKQHPSKVTPKSSTTPPANSTSAPIKINAKNSSTTITKEKTTNTTKTPGKEKDAIQKTSSTANASPSPSQSSSSLPQTSTDINQENFTFGSSSALEPSEEPTEATSLTLSNETLSTSPLLEANHNLSRPTTNGGNLATTQIVMASQDVLVEDDLAANDSPNLESVDKVENSLRRQRHSTVQDAINPDDQETTRDHLATAFKEEEDRKALVEEQHCQGLSTLVTNRLYPLCEPRYSVWTFHANRCMFDRFGGCKFTLNIFESRKLCEQACLSTTSGSQSNETESENSQEVDAHIHEEHANEFNDLEPAAEAHRSNTEHGYEDDPMRPNQDQRANWDKVLGQRRENPNRSGDLHNRDEDDNAGTNLRSDPINLTDQTNDNLREMKHERFDESQYAEDGMRRDNRRPVESLNAQQRPVYRITGGRHGEDDNSGSVERKDDAAEHDGYSGPEHYYPLGRINSSYRNLPEEKASQGHARDGNYEWGKIRDESGPNKHAKTMMKGPVAYDDYSWLHNYQAQNGISIREGELRPEVKYGDPDRTNQSGEKYRKISSVTKDPIFPRDETPKHETQDRSNIGSGEKAEIYSESRSKLAEDSDGTLEQSRKIAHQFNDYIHGSNAGSSERKPHVPELEQKLGLRDQGRQLGLGSQFMGNRAHGNKEGVDLNYRRGPKPLGVQNYSYREGDSLLGDTKDREVIGANLERRIMWPRTDGRSQDLVNKTSAPGNGDLHSHEQPRMNDNEYAAHNHAQSRDEFSRGGTEYQMRSKSDSPNDEDMMGEHSVTNAKINHHGKAIHVDHVQDPGKSIPGKSDERSSSLEESSEKSLPPRSMAVARLNPQVCLEPWSDRGKCEEHLKKWTYVNGICVNFVYGGCGATGNIFDTLVDCEKTCTPP